MRSIRKKESTKKILLDAYRQLYYELGYSKVTMQMVADAVQVHISLITYYFGNKNGPVFDIFHGVMEEILERVEEIVDEGNPMTAWFLFRFKYYEVIFSDERNVSFYRDSILQPSYNSAINPFIGRYAAKLSRRYPAGLSEKQVAIKVMEYHAAVRAFAGAYLNGTLECSREEFIYNRSTLLPEILRVPIGEIEVCYRMAQKLHETETFPEFRLLV